MPTFREIFEQSWYPDVPHYNAGAFVPGVPDSPQYLVDPKQVYQLQEEIDRVIELPPSIKKSHRLEALTRAKNLTEQGIPVPLISLRDFLQSLLEAFSVLFRSRGLNRLADIAVLDFNLESFLATLIAKFDEFWEASLALAAASQVTHAILEGSGIPQNERLFDPNAVPAILNIDKLSEGWMSPSGADIYWKQFDVLSPVGNEVSLRKRAKDYFEAFALKLRQGMDSLIADLMSDPRYGSELRDAPVSCLMTAQRILTMLIGRASKMQGSTALFDPSVLVNLKEAAKVCYDIIAKDDVYKRTTFEPAFSYYGGKFVQEWLLIRPKMSQAIYELESEFGGVSFGGAIGIGALPSGVPHGFFTDHITSDLTRMKLLKRRRPDGTGGRIAEVGRTPLFLPWFDQTMRWVKDMFNVLDYPAEREKFIGRFQMRQSLERVIDICEKGATLGQQLNLLLTETASGTASFVTMMSELSGIFVYPLAFTFVDMDDELRALMKGVNASVLPAIEDRTRNYSDNTGVGLFFRFMDAVADIQGQRRTNLGGRLGYKIEPKFLGLGSGYVTLIQLFEDLYTLQLEGTGRTESLFNSQEYRTVKAALRSLLYRQFGPNVQVIGGINKNKLEASLANYHNLFFIKEVYLASQETMTAEQQDYVSDRFQYKHLRGAVDSLFKIEKDSENATWSTRSKGLFGQMYDIWKGFSDIVHDELPYYYKQMSPWHQRQHMSGDQLAVLKSSHDKWKAAYYHLVHDIDHAISTEKEWLFIGKHWAPGYAVNTGDKFLYKGGYYQAKANFHTDENTRPDPLLGNFNTYWETGAWNYTTTYATNDIVLRDGIFYIALLPGRDYLPHTEFNSQYWKRLSLFPNEQYKKGDRFIYLKEKDPTADWYKHRTDIVVLTAQADGTAPSNLTNFYKNLFQYGSANWKVDYQGDSATKGLAPGSNTFTEMGPWSVSSNHAARWSYFRIPRTTPLALNPWPHWKGYWNYPSGVSNWGSFKAEGSAPLSTYAHRSSPWLKKESDDYINLTGGHKTGHEYTRPFYFSLQHKHGASALGLLGMTVLQNLEMAFYSHSMSWAGVADVRIVSTPAQIAAFGRPKDVRGVNTDWAFHHYNYKVYIYGFITYVDRASYWANPQTPLNSNDMGHRFINMADVVAPFMRTTALQIKHFMLELMEYRDTIRVECSRFIRSTLIEQQRLLAEISSLDESQLESVSPEEIQLLKRIMGLIIAIIVALLLSDDRLSSSIVSTGGAIYFDSTLLDSIFFEERTAQILMQRALDIVKNFLERQTKPDHFHEEAVAASLVIDLQFFNNESTLRKRENRQFRSEEEYRYQILDQRG